MDEPDQLDPAYDTPVIQDDPVMTLSEEVATLGTEWHESGRVRLRRRIVTETRTIEVRLRREELVVELDGREVDGEEVDTAAGQVLGGADPRGAAVTPPVQRQPLVIVLQQEVPEVGLRLTPYEVVTVSTALRTRTGRLAVPLRHEELEFEQT